MKTSEVDLSNINSKEVIQIGFFQNREGIIQVVKMPVTIEKVSDHLPSELDLWKICLWMQEHLIKIFQNEIHKM